MQTCKLESFMFNYFETLRTSFKKISAEMKTLNLKISNQNFKILFAGLFFTLAQKAFNLTKCHLAIKNIGILN